MKFIQLIRPVNLIIIAIAMYGVLFYLTHVQFANYELVHHVNFGLLVFSTILIAAGGNIINDYFDVKADRINKPDRLIITRHIKPRWAIVTHWFLNSFAFLIAIYLSVFYKTYSIVFIHLLSINLLWFYSFTFKRKGLVGNIIVALLTAMIPLLALVFYFKLNEYEGFNYLNPKANYTFIFWLAFFAFLQNFAREILKDIQDIEGDRIIKAKTLPLTIGIRKSHSIIILLLLIFPLILAFFALNNMTHLHQSELTPVIFYTVAGLNNIVIVLIVFTGIRTIRLQDHLVKLSMLIGLLSLFFIHTT